MADRNNNLGSSGRSDDSISNPDPNSPDLDNPDLDNPDLDRGQSGGLSGSQSDRDRSEIVGDEPDRSGEDSRSGTSGGSGYGGQSGQGGSASRR